MMKKLRPFITLIAAMLLSTMVWAQQFPMTNHYLVNAYSLSPATAGSLEKGALFFNYRKDWLNLGKSPETMRFNTHFHIGNNMYLGAEAYLDKVDIMERFKGSLSYTYRLQMAEEQYLHFGIWGSVYQNTVRIDQITGNPDDPLIRNLDQLTKMTYNAGFSLVYFNRGFEAGIGMPTLLRTKDAYLEVSQGNFAFEQEFQFHIGNRFRLSPAVQLRPVVLLRRTSNQPTIVDVSASFIFAEKFYITGLYRNSQVVALGVGGQLFNSMNLYYTYELGLGGIHYDGGGSHEITLGFRFGRLNADDVENYQPNPRKSKSKKYMLHEYQQMYEQKYRRD